MRLRLRLALIYGLLASVVLALSVVLAYGYYARAAYRNLDGALAILLEPIRLTLTEWGRFPEGAEAYSAYPFAIRFYSPSGDLVDTLENTIQAPEADSAAVLAGDNPFPYSPFVTLLPRLRVAPPPPEGSAYGLLEQGGQRWRVYVTTIAQEGQTRGTLQVVGPLTPTDQVLADLRRNLFLAWLGGSLLVLALGYQLSRPALRPLARLAATASRAVNAAKPYAAKPEVTEALSRVTAEGDDRELAGLADTLNRAFGGLRESEERFRKLADSMPQIVWANTPEGQVNYFNQRWLEYTGLSLEESLRDPNLPLHPEDRPVAEQIWAENIKQGKPFEYELRLRRHDGEYRWHLTRCVPVLDTAGGLSGWYGTSTDIHERKLTEAALQESEARYRSLVEASAQVVWRADREGRLLYPKERWSAMSGFPPDELPEDVLELVHPEDRERGSLQWQKSVERKAPLGFEQRVRWAGGGYRHWQVRAAPVWEADGRVREWIGTDTDIHERKLAEEALRESEERYRKLSESQKRFVNDAAHELRAPLTAIQGNLELLTRFKHMSKPDREEALIEVNQEAQRLSRLVNDMLALARGDAGEGIRWEEVRLDRALAEAFRAAQGLTRSHRMSLGELPEVTLSGDPDRLKQLALQLLENAVKYTPEGGEVRLELARCDGHAEFRVTDTGIGIAPDDLERVFERFYRADKARSRAAGGTGLGLSIARWIAEGHGGRVWLESEIGKGTTAVVRLPLGTDGAARPPD